MFVEIVLLAEGLFPLGLVIILFLSPPTPLHREDSMGGIIKTISGVR